MNSETTEQTRSAAWLIVAAAGVRAAFGVVMAVDAYLKWQPAFAEHYVGYLQNAANAQPAWLPWFNFWLRIVTPNVGFFVSATRLIESAIALGLLLVLRAGSPISSARFSVCSSGQRTKVSAVSIRRAPRTSGPRSFTRWSSSR